MMTDDNTYKLSMRTAIMPGVLVNTRIPEQLHTDVTLFADAAGYGGVQEFVREAIREHLQRRRIEWGRQEMRKLYGIAKGKKIKELTGEERDALVDEFFGRSAPKRGSMRKRYGSQKGKKIRKP